MNTSPAEPRHPCSKCQGRIFHLLQQVWQCLGCEGLPRCPIPERWACLPPVIHPSAVLVAQVAEVPLEEVNGSGPGGMILLRDIKRFVEERTRRKRERGEPW